MNPERLLVSLACKGISVHMKDGKLVCQAPDGVLDEDTLALIKNNRDEIVEYAQRKNGNLRPRLPDVGLDQSRTAELFYRQQNWWNAVKQGRGLAAIGFDYRPWGRRVEPIPFREAVYQLIQRHDALRISIRKNDEGAITQYVHEECRLHVPYFDISTAEKSRAANEKLGGGSTDDDALRVIKEYLKNFGDISPNRSLCYIEAPLFRVALIRKTSSEYGILLYMDHIIGDGMSLSILERELYQIYNSIVEDFSPDIPQLPFRYIDFVNWNNKYYGEGTIWRQREIEYWQDYYGQLKPSRIPHENVDVCKKDQLYTETLYFKMTDYLCRKLKDRVESGRVTEFNLLFSAFGAALGTHLDNRTVTVATIMSGRNYPGTQGLVGHFAELLFIKIELERHLTAEKLTKQVAASLIALQSHLNIDSTPYLPLGVSSIDSREYPVAPSSSVVFSGEFYREIHSSEVNKYSEHFNYEAVPHDAATSPKLIWFRAFKTNQQFYFTVSYDKSCHSREMIGALVRNFLKKAEKAACSFDAPLF